MSRPLKRGKACMNCRFLKIKCDGQKPICGPCRKHPKDDECEYSDGQARSRTKALEDTVARLEARLHELEHPEDPTPAVHDPYMQYSPPPQLTRSSSYASSSSFRSHSPYSPPSSPSSFGSSPLGIFDSRGSAMTPESNTSSVDFGTVHGRDLLLQTFLRHASGVGFFLDTKRFMQSLTERSMRPSSALLNAVYMWGAHLSADPREERFKYQALQCAATDLKPAHPQSFLHTIQAEVLLSQYFFRNGNFLEARAHTATAVALALGGGLHRIRSLRHPDVPVIGITEANEEGVHLRAPADAIEEGERINGFWAVFMLQSNLAVALLPAAHDVSGVFEPGGMQVDTPWPLEMDDYKQGLLTSDIHGDSTVRNYLSQPGPSSYQERPSIMAMNARACLLLHRAVYLHGQWTPNVAHSLSTAFDAVELRINTLRSQLPDLAQLDSRSAVRTILLTRSLLNSATIKLHSLYTESSAAARQHCLAAARDMFYFGDTNLQGLGYVNAIMGTLWLTACSVFIAELKRMREDARPAHAPSEEKEIYASLQDGLAALSAFARESLLMRHQLTKAHEAMSGL
ncbi:hypothetical protein DFH07DRAFT_790706 [Mycena maculata]|uniref:Zn(2)-C6 fungal-type domain-containing protein n=1 Tax=Mycena maculata TaxID=230809 RepID=A0AAD7KBY4_9AGAR|nr:hypothetical protein DFH07DRAFT_790706 [Mycena maculata]